MDFPMKYSGCLLTDYSPFDAYVMPQRDCQYHIDISTVLGYLRDGKVAGPRPLKAYHDATVLSSYLTDSVTTRPEGT